MTAHVHHHEENPHAGQGTVLLDIGGDVGALVVAMPEDLVGHEVDVRPEGVEVSGHVPHVAVHRRPTADGTWVPSLVFPELVAGRYELCPKGTREVALVVEVRGGEVSTAEWPR